MGKRMLTVGSGAKVNPCPKCGNTTRFTLHAERCAEDLCETFVVCVCGHEPTETGERYENVWGDMTREAAAVALDCWNDAIAGAPDA